MRVSEFGIWNPYGLRGIGKKDTRILTVIYFWLLAASCSSDYPIFWVSVLGGIFVGPAFATMVEIGSKKVRLSDCRSIGSNTHLSGRSAKVSIGITVEKSTTVVSGVGKEDGSALNFSEKHLSCKGVFVDNRSRSGVAVNMEATKVELNEQKNAECLLSRLSYCKTSSADAGKLDVNGVWMLHSVDSTLKRVGSAAYVHKRDKDGMTNIHQGLAFDTMQDINLPDQEIGRNGEEKSTADDLKLKLSEILGGFHSQKEHNMSSPKLENKENIGVHHNRGLWEGRVPRTIHSSDPIETDSDSLNQTIRRPATRSMTRKKASTKIMNKLHRALNNGKKPLSSTCSDHKPKAEENLRSGDERKIFSFNREGKKRTLKQSACQKRKADSEDMKISRSSSGKNPNVETNFKVIGKDNIFSFVEGEGNRRMPEKSTSFHFKRLNEKRNTSIRLRTIHPPSRSSLKSTMQKIEWEQSFPSPAKMLQHMNDSSPCLPCPSKKQSIQTKNFQNDSQHSQRNVQTPLGIPLEPKLLSYENIQSSLQKKEKESCKYVNCSSVSKFAFQHDEAACCPMTNKAYSSDDLQSPTLAGNEAPNIPCRSSYEIVGSPLPTRNMNVAWNFHSSDIMGHDTPESCSETNTESSGDTKEICNSQDLESTFVDGKQTNQRLSLSPTLGHDSDNLGAKKSKSKEFIQRSKWFPNFDNSEKFPLKFHEIRMFHGFKDTKLSEGNSSSPSCVDVSSETIDLHEASDQRMEDSLARAVNQLALALRGFKSKIQLHTNKKNCEILEAVADKIKQQLQDVESKIQEDMGLFTSTSKSKRKRLELQFEEQQVRLRSIHDKFKEEVNHHLLICSSTLEELDAQNVEMQGTTEIKEAMHKKFLLQIEETMKDLLTAAETNIVAVRKDARKKLNSLKFALKEYLGEGGLA